MKPKISIIIPAHDEEDRIAKVLSNLYNFPYNNYEVIIGLDNCHDRTLSIVKQMYINHGNFKYYVFKERQGKAQMINKLIAKAQGDIIVMHDCDWELNINKHDLNYILEIFKNEYVHGISDPYPITYPIKKDAGILETGITLHSLVWMDAIKDKATDFCPGYKKLNENYMPLLTNIFKKKSYIANTTLADDFERTKNIQKQSRAVLVADGLDPSRMISAGEHYTLCGMFTQKKRSALAREQIEQKYGKGTMNIPKWDLMKSIWRNVIRPCKIKYIWSFGIVTLIYLCGSIFKPKDTSTKDGWNMRAR